MTVVLELDDGGGPRIRVFGVTIPLSVFPLASVIVSFPFVNDVTVAAGAGAVGDVVGGEVVGEVVGALPIRRVCLRAWWVCRRA